MLLGTLALACTPAPAFPAPPPVPGRRRRGAGRERPALPPQVLPHASRSSGLPAAVLPQGAPGISGRSCCRAAKANPRRSLAAAQPGGTRCALTLGKSPPSPGGPEPETPGPCLSRWMRPRGGPWGALRLRRPTPARGPPRRGQVQPHRPTPKGSRRDSSKDGRKRYQTISACEIFKNTTDQNRAH